MISYIWVLWLYFAAIVALKEELTRCEKSNAMPVLEEFMTLKSIADEEHQIFENSEDKHIKRTDKMDWMSSVQLWNSDNQHLDDKQNLKPDNIKVKLRLQTL